jgi:indolepyruvate ferredoxin oxidoreductase alpha subunit
MLRTSSVAPQVSIQHVLLGDEAVALGAIHAGASNAYGYPGTPSTEILEYVLAQAPASGIRASWCANEKTAYETAVGVSMAGKRVLVTMKHVGLNVAADPFINSALVPVEGGLVLAVADDPSMHSSQNEQDSRVLADYARVPCLEPGNQQEAYEMTRLAFDLSERWKVPVMVRLVTRLCHSRAPVVVRASRRQNELHKGQEESGTAAWTLLPRNARLQWRRLLDLQEEFLRYSEGCRLNTLASNEARTDLGVVTAGIGRNYYLENLRDLEHPPSHLHIGAYPAPVEKLRRFAGQVRAVLVLEDGYPFLERRLRGILPTTTEIRGRLSGHLPEDGELTPDNVRTALGLAPLTTMEPPPFPIPARPPQLCRGCPHGDAYTALNAALEGHEHKVVTGDIGCYTLGALPPYRAIESTLCMGASIGMARGAAEAGLGPAVAVIGDSTFLHSGVTPLMDAVTADANITVLILDNEVVGMTGAQPTLMPSQRLRQMVLGTGIDEAHCHYFELHPKKVGELTELIRGELAHEGVSVIIAARECLQAARARKKAAQRSQSR